MKQNTVEDEAIQKFGANLTQLTALRELSMNESRFTKSAIETLSPYLVKCVALEKLNIPGLGKIVYMHLINLTDYFTKIN